MKKIIQIEPWINNLELDELKKVISSTFVTESKLNEEFKTITSYLSQSKILQLFAMELCIILLLKGSQNRGR